MRAACLLAVLALCIPSCETFQSSSASVLTPLASRNAALHTAQCGAFSRDKGVGLAAHRLGGRGGRGAPGSGLLALRSEEGGQGEGDKFDAVTGYTDMTGVARFDEAWEAAYRRKDGIRCPFWRRRTVDALEMVLNAARFVVSRHKSLDVTPVRPTGVAKSEGMTLAQVADVVRADFEERQYYVTGRLSKRVYADDCFFDAPDPDMPVRGLRKYVDAISHLFETRTSRVDLLGMELLPERGAILARWRLEGTLMLPWRPAVRAYTGVTLYELGPSGLVTRHTELWSQHVVVAFLSAVVSVDDPRVQRALGLIGIDVPPPAPPADEIVQTAAEGWGPDPAPLLSRGGGGGGGILGMAGEALGRVGRRSSTG